MAVTVTVTARHPREKAVDVAHVIFIFKFVGVPSRGFAVTDCEGDGENAKLATMPLVCK